MPTNNRDRGPSYAGHVDVSHPDTVTPDWAEAAPEQPLEAEQTDTDVEVEPVATKPAPRARRRPAARKTTSKAADE